MTTPAIGLLQHVRGNDRRSMLLFGGFLLAVHLMTVVVLFVPLAMFDAAHAPFLAWGGYFGRYFLAITVAAGGLFFLRFWWTVNSIRRDTSFRYVDAADEPRLCRLLEPLIIAAGIRTPYVGVIDSPSLNAFACGVRPSNMVVVVTRGLIDGLDDDELEAVLAHELIHIRNRDTRLMAAANAFMSNLTWLRRRGGMPIEDYRAAFSLVVFPIFVPIILIAGFLSQLAFRIGYCSRAIIGSAREFVADAEAIRLTQKPAALVAALQKVDGHSRVTQVGDLHDAMLIAGATRGPAATHPAIAERIAALVRTTGSMTFVAPARRDTREPTLRTAAGFGRRALSMGDAMAAAAAPRAGIVDIFRLTADPDQNIFGLKAKGVVIMLIAALGFCAINWHNWNRGDLVSRQFNMSILGGLGEAQIMGLKCQYLGLTGAPDFAEACEGQAMDDMMRKLDLPTGLGLGKFQSASADAAQATTVQMLNLCVEYSIHDWPRRRPIMSLAQSDESRGASMPLYQRFAGQPVGGVDTEPTASLRDAPLLKYFETRRLLADHAFYFYGEAGLAQFRRWLDTPSHRRALELLGRRLDDPDFTKRLSSFMLADLRVTVAHPDTVMPCDAKRADGSYRQVSA